MMTIATYCYQCVNGPDLLTVEVEDGIAKRIGPNFDVRGMHPADGKICVKPYGLLEKLYNPHRVLQPMKRTNPRKGRNEDPGWVAISWDEALDLVAAKLAPLRAAPRDEHGNPRVAFTVGGAGTPLRYMGAFPALMRAWGPVDQSLGAGGTVACYHSEHVYGELWHRAFAVSPDTPLCDYVVSFGNNINASGGVTSVRRHADARERGMRRVQIEPHLTVTGATASEWIPIRPKTDSAFLFAMLHVLLHEHASEALDVAFLKQHTASPYLVGPNGYYLRGEDDKPLVWNPRRETAVPYDAPDCDPALIGRFECAAVSEKGADAQRWVHARCEARPAHQLLVEHVASFTPEWAAEVCDVAAAKIRRVANDFLAAARIGETIEIAGERLPLRPVAVMLGKAVNNGWGAYECVWARTMLQILVGALEVPGGLIGSVTRIVGPDYDRMASCVPGEDGFMAHPFLPTDRDHWRSDPDARHAHSTLTPMTGHGPLAQALGSSTFAWLRLQGRAADTWARPKPPDVWFMYRGNPLISNNETERLAETIAAFPFQVAFVYTHDETSHFADLLLPDCMDLESLQLIRVGGSESFEQFWEAEGWVLRQPVVAPRGEARSFDWIATRLAERLGMLEAFNGAINAGACGLPLGDFALDPAKAHDSEAIWDAVCRAASNDLTGGQESDGLDYYREKGFRTRPFSRLNWYLFPRMKAQGLRFELPYQERLLRMGRQLGNRLHERDIAWWDRQLAEYEALPHYKDLNRLWVEALERNYGAKADDYPFWVLTSRSMQFAWGGNAGIPLMREVARNVRGHDGIQINASRAAALGIREGDRIEVRSPVGSVTGRARLREGVRPDVVVLIGQFGHWKTPVAREGDMPSLNSLVPMHVDFLDGGGSTVDATKVSVRRLA